MTKTTSLVSNMLMNMGVSRIEVTSMEDVIRFQPQSLKSFNLNQKNIEFSNYSFIIKDGWLLIDGNENTKVSIIDNEPHIQTPIYAGSLEYSNLDDNIEVNLLVIFLNEIITKENNKIDMELYLQQDVNRVSSGCSFWNTWYVTAGGASRSGSQANLAYITTFEREDGSLDGCSKIGGVDTSCMIDSHWCFSSQAYCCN